MKISYEWLREYVNTKIRAENLASLLTMAGHEVTSVEHKGNDFIFEIEVTPNRADCLCHIGMAREVSCITKKSLKLPAASIQTKKKIKQIRLDLKDKDACAYYSARVISGARVSQSPKWLMKKIESIGLRPVNNIVDITNFVLFETGEPLHAFDLDKIKGDEIIIRRARAGERIATIDGSIRTLEPHMLVIADIERPIAIAGVMGGKDTEVTEDTKNILLEAAYFNPIVIRRTALSLGLSTDSSYRFERGVDLLNIVPASNRAASLICGIAKGDAGDIVDAGVKEKEINNITLRPQRVNKILGAKLSLQQIKDILSRLGFKSKGTSFLEVTAPSFRGDVTREADLIEEIARIYGYENIASAAPNIITTDEDTASKDMVEKKDIAKGLLTSLGFNEVITYSLVSRQLIERIGLPQEGVIEIKNPLSKEQEVMRPSLLQGLIKTVSYNISRQIQDIKIFELSNTYFLKEGIYNEEPFLSFAYYSKTHKKEKEQSLAKEGIFYLKGVITTLCERLGTADVGFETTQHPILVPSETLAVLSGTSMVGTIGRVKTEIAQAFDIKEKLFVAELNFNTLAAFSNLNRFYRPLPRFPYSYRDISFGIDEKIPYKDIINLVRSRGGPLVERIELLSEYHGEQIQKGRRGLAVRVIYQSKDRTLTEEEVNKLDTEIREKITKALGAAIR